MPARHAPEAPRACAGLAQHKKTHRRVGQLVSKPAPVNQLPLAFCANPTNAVAQIIEAVGLLLARANR